MARRATQISSWTKGVLDPDLSERQDLQHYYNSLADGYNLEVKPQGGLARSAGSLINSDADVIAGGYQRRTRRQIEPLAISSGQITAHNGGTAANLVDQDPQTLFTTSSAGSGTFVVAEIDLGSAQPVAFVDVIGFFAETAGKDNVLAVEYYDGSAWVEMRGSIDAGASTRRHIRTRGYQTPATARLASTQNVPLVSTGTIDIDGLTVANTDLVLLKMQSNPAQNGLYVATVSLGTTLARATAADTAAEVLQAAYYISAGTINGGSTWVNQQKTLGDLNGFPTTAAVTYAPAPSIAGRTRRFGEWVGVAPSARYWRVVVKDANGVGAISVSGLRIWKERAVLAPPKIFAFDKSIALMYDLVLTERNVDVFKVGPSRGRRYVASIPVPIAAHQIAEVSAVQSKDSLFLFHEDIPTIRIVRQGSDQEWNADTLPAYNVPQVRGGTFFSGNQDEIREIALPGIVNGQQFVLFLGDMVTAPITYAGPGTIGAQISAALDALPGVAAPTVTLMDSTPTLRIAMTGSNGDRAWPDICVLMLGAAAVVPLHSLVQAGFTSAGPFFGDKTGWPRCGAIAQGRLVVGGFRAAPTSWGCSAIDSFNFQDDPGPAPDADTAAPPLTADMAFFRTLDSDQVETIQQIYIGRNLQFFTDSSEWYVESRTLDATQPANAIRSTGVGIKSSARCAFAEGATVIVQQGGRTIRDVLYSDVEQAYKAEPLSLLGPHLLTDVVDLAHRKARTTQEANLLFFINADGSMTTLSLLRAQEVIGMIRQTNGAAWRSVASHVNGDIVFIVERHGDNWIEVRDDTQVLDAAVRKQAVLPFTEITGLDHLEGDEVWAFAGSQLCGPFTVEDGGITLDDQDAATDVSVGRFRPIYGRLQKLREKLQNEQPFRAPGRIYEAGLSLKETGHLQVRANGAAWREVPLTYVDGGTLDYGELADSETGYGPELPMLDRLLTGDVTLQNLRGFSKHPTFEFRQVVPAPAHLKAIRLEIAMRG